VQGAVKVVAYKKNELLLLSFWECKKFCVNGINSSEAERSFRGIFEKILLTLFIYHLYGDRHGTDKRND